MNRFKGNIVGLMGMAACAAIGLLDSIGNTWALGPQLVISIPRIDATLAAHLAAGFVTDSSGLQITTFYVHLVLRSMLVAVFASALWARTSPSRRWSTSLDKQLLGGRALIALIGPTELVHVVAAELPIVLPFRSACKWLCLLVAVDIAVKVPYVIGLLGDTRLLANHSAVTMCIAWDSVLHPVFFGMGLLFRAESRGRAKLACANAELLATRQLLDDAVRRSERARIARDLHDALGHHLTALNLHLDLALRQIGSENSQSLHTSRELARSLLAEVRTTVNSQRGQRGMNLRQALETLCAGIPFPNIALSYDERLEIGEPGLVETIFRTVQEAVTNAVRHSGASEVIVNLNLKNDGLAILVRDDGGGANHLEEGNGLNGIRERVETLGGQIRTATCAHGGFSLHVWLPQLAGAS